MVDELQCIKNTLGSIYRRAVPKRIKLHQVGARNRCGTSRGKPLLCPFDDCRSFTAWWIKIAADLIPLKGKDLPKEPRRMDAQGIHECKAMREINRPRFTSPTKISGCSVNRLLSTRDRSILPPPMAVKRIKYAPRPLFRPIRH